MSAGNLVIRVGNHDGEHRIYICYIGREIVAVTGDKAVEAADKAAVNPDIGNSCPLHGKLKMLSF